MVQELKLGEAEPIYCQCKAQRAAAFMAGGLGAALGPQKLMVLKSAEMHSEHHDSMERTFKESIYRYHFRPLSPSKI